MTILEHNYRSFTIPYVNIQDRLPRKKSVKLGVLLILTNTSAYLLDVLLQMTDQFVL